MALENNLGLTSSADLAREEERISKKKVLELFDTGMRDRLEAGTIAMERSPIKDVETKCC